MAGEIIRLGDKTSHDGDVIEGSQTDICMASLLRMLATKPTAPNAKVISLSLKV